VKKVIQLYLYLHSGFFFWKGVGLRFEPNLVKKKKKKRLEPKTCADQNPLLYWLIQGLGDGFCTFSTN
jgi:hypothetical protein